MDPPLLGTFPGAVPAGSATALDLPHGGRAIIRTVLESSSGTRNAPDPTRIPWLDGRPAGTISVEYPSGLYHPSYFHSSTVDIIRNSAESAVNAAAAPRSTSPAVAATRLKLVADMRSHVLTRARIISFAAAKNGRPQNQDPSKVTIADLPLWSRATFAEGSESTRLAGEPSPQHLVNDRPGYEGVSSAAAALFHYLSSAASSNPNQMAVIKVDMTLWFGSPPFRLHRAMDSYLRLQRDGTTRSPEGVPATRLDYLLADAAAAPEPPPRARPAASGPAPAGNMWGSLAKLPPPAQDLAPYAADPPPRPTAAARAIPPPAAPAEEGIGRLCQPPPALPEPLPSTTPSESPAPPPSNPSHGYVGATASPDPSDVLSRIAEAVNRLANASAANQGPWAHPLANAAAAADTIDAASEARDAALLGAAFENAKALSCAAATAANACAAIASICVAREHERRERRAARREPPALPPAAAQQSGCPPVPPTMPHPTAPWGDTVQALGNQIYRGIAAIPGFPPRVPPQGHGRPPHGPRRDRARPPRRRPRRAPRASDGSARMGHEGPAELRLAWQGRHDRRPARAPMRGDRERRERELRAHAPILPRLWHGGGSPRARARGRGERRERELRAHAFSPPRRPWHGRCGGGPRARARR